MNTIIKIKKSLISNVQKLGKSLMLPVSVLPAAGLMLGIGAANLGVIPQVISTYMESAGGAIFGILPLLFAIGVALGFTENDGVSALGAAIGFFVMLATMGIMAQTLGYETKVIMGVKSVDTGVFGGILVGGLVSILFNRFHKIQLPTYLGFFGGKRFIPIITAFSAIFLGIILSILWPPVGQLIKSFSVWASSSNPEMAFGIYGVVERLLIPFGLHHIWNVPFFFEVGEFIGNNGEIIQGEIHRYLAGDPAAGHLAGGYLFKMWGLPAAGLAIWHCSSPEKKQMVGSIMLSAALTSFITGITEPLEFAFMFVAPVLYLLHALLSGVAFTLCVVLGLKHGTTFSHGLIDFIVLFSKSTNGLGFFILGPIWALGYYSIFRIAILKLNLKTPGREDSLKTLVSIKTTSSIGQDQRDEARLIINALGGASNIKSIDACITRLRVTLNDITSTKADDLKGLGAAGVITVGESLQAIFGPRSENIKTEIIAYLKNPILESETRPKTASLAPTSLINMLGGAQNIVNAEALAHTRLRLTLKNQIEINHDQFVLEGVQAVVPLSDNIYHLIVGSGAQEFACILENQLKTELLMSL